MASFRPILRYWTQAPNSQAVDSSCSQFYIKTDNSIWFLLPAEVLEINVDADVSMRGNKAGAICLDAAGNYVAASVMIWDVSLQSLLYCNRWHAKKHCLLTSFTGLGLPRKTYEVQISH